MLFLGSSAFVAIGVFIFDSTSIIDWVGIAFFSLGMIVSLILFFPNTSYLKLNEEGFEEKIFFRSHFTRWTEAENFRQGRVGGSKMILFNYTEHHTKWKHAKRLAKFLAGNEGAIRSTYNISTEDLLALMQEYKLKYQ